MGVISQTLSVQRAIEIWHNNIEKEVLNGFQAVTEAASFVTIPVTAGKVVLG
jgi:hypothetical protein